METETQTQVAKKFASLAEKRPDLAKEWNYEKNGGLRPEDVSCGSTKKVWWMQFIKNPVTGKMMKSEWKASIANRVNGNGNPIASNQMVMSGYNDLEFLHPDVAAEWNYERNGTLKPSMVTCGMCKKVWWVRYIHNEKTGELIKFEWEESISKRVLRKDKVMRRLIKGYNDLKTLHPELADEWNYKRNGTLTPDMVTCGTDKKVWWIQYDKSPVTGEIIPLEWKSSISHRVLGEDNPIKVGKQVLVGYNDFATLYPEIATEWNYERNGSLTPDMVTSKSNKTVWWVKYEISPATGKTMKLEWKTSIVRRANGDKCPYTSNHQVLKNFNDLESMRPEIAEEWNYARNGNLKPDMIMYQSTKVVWWIQKIRDEKTGDIKEYEWKASVLSRTKKGAKNPYVFGYNGENYIKRYLQEHNIVFNTQQKFNDLIGLNNGQLSYDFAIPDELYGFVLIEYNGQQHYKSIEIWGGDKKLLYQQEHDRRKREYAKKHGYKLITIKYTYDTYKKIATYLNKNLLRVNAA